MKRIVFYLLALSLLLSLGSCFYTSEPLHPRPEPWLCSVNADGTGFRMIKKVDLSFGTTGFWDIYMTKDDRIIFYGERLWISETDTIRPIQITPDNLTLIHLPSRLSQSPDGSKLFFAADKNIYQLSYPDFKLTQLTNQSIRWLRNPIVSDLGNYITYSSNGFGYPTKETEYLYWMNLSTGESSIVPTADSLVVNVFYSEAQDFVYYERIGLHKSRLDGSDSSIVDNLAANITPYPMYAFSNDMQYVVRLRQLQPPVIRVFNLQTNTAVELPVIIGPQTYPLGALSRGTNDLFYVSPGNKLCVYHLDTGENTVILPGTGDPSISRFINIAPTWDGSKVYFYAEISVN